MAKCASATEIMGKGLHDLAVADIETRSRTQFIMRTQPGIMEKLATVMRQMISDPIRTPESFARQSPSTWGKIVPTIQNSITHYQRDQQRYHHIINEELRLAGIGRGKEGRIKDAYMHMLGLNVSKRHLFGPDALSNKELRRRFSAFVRDEIPYTDVLMANKARELTPVSVKEYQGMVARIDDVLSDRDIDYVRDITRVQDEMRSIAKSKFMERLKADKRIRAEEYPMLMDQAFGPDLDAYLPALRHRMRMGAEDIKAGAKIGDFEGVFARDIEAFDRMMGVDHMDESLAEGLADLATFIADPQKGRFAPGFQFKDAKSLGLAEGKVYERADDAVAELFDFIGAGEGGVEALNRNQRDLLTEAIGVLRRMAQGRPKTVVGDIKYVPEHLRVRFYQRRMLSSLPINASILNAHSVYSNAVLRDIHLNPVLPGIVDVISATKRSDPTQALAMISFVDSAIGNPARLSAPVLGEVGRLVGVFYKATLLGNLSAAAANYLGQTGFIVGEAGLRPTMVAMRALFEGRNGKFYPLLDLLDTVNIGREAIPAGEAARVVGLHGKLAALSGAPTKDEALRRMYAYGTQAVDVFSASEMRLRKVAYLSGVVQHLEKAGIWKPGMEATQIDAAFRGYAEKGGLDAMREAGERTVARGAFLFGNINQPAAIRWLKENPLAAPAAMFSNYPIQAYNRLLIWSHDAIRVRQDPAAAKEAAAKLFRFFAYGTVVGGPFFMLPVLRGMRDAPGLSEEDTTLVKDMFVSWEKNYSVAGLMGAAIQAVSGEYETLAVAEKISPFPSTTDPVGPLGTIGGGPAVQLAFDLFRGAGIGQEGGAAGQTASMARESMLGGWLENAISGQGSPSRPFPTSGVATILPGGVALGRLLNSFASGVLSQEEPVVLDRYGRVKGPTTMSMEIIRQFGRPLGEVLQGTEGRIADREAEQRTRNAERIKRAVLEGKVALVGEYLTNDPTLYESIEPRDLQRAAMARELAPQARAMLTSAEPLMKKALLRAVNKLSVGGLAPAEEFTLKQQVAIGMMRLKRARERGD